MNKSILVLDFGSQYTQLIARRIRELKVYCEIYPYYVDDHLIQQQNWCGIILSGSPKSVLDADAPQIMPWILESKLPILGICYGMQALAHQLDGVVEPGLVREFGEALIHIDPKPDSPFLNFEADSLSVWMSHGDKVTQLPSGFESLAGTSDIQYAAMADTNRHWYGLQFHPEVTHTPDGLELLKQFVIDICHASHNWTTSNIFEDKLRSIRTQVKDDHILLALSGGVDSSVVASLLHHAVGKQLHAVFVDTGLLRTGEAEQVRTILETQQRINFTCVDAKARFLKALKGIICPEEKRKIIGHLFIEIFEEVAQKLPQIKWLAQGTIYPDVIESAGIREQSSAELIKSHHNVGGLPEALPFKLLEPLKMLFKDEVRVLGQALKLPDERLFQHPFPGPGMAVRVLGEVTEAALIILRKADKIFIDELKKAKLYQTVSQAFAVFLPVNSVGVMGDGRKYAPVIGLRAVETQDFMTARWARLPWAFLDAVSLRIVNEIDGISRVVYDVSGKPPATIEWE